MNIEARGGYRYFLTFTDDLSRYGYIYLLIHKSVTFEKFKEFQSEVENHRNKNESFYGMFAEVKYLCYEVWSSIKTMWNSFTNSCHLEHHSIMVCPNVITILY